jgi:hypothetical protein
VENYTSVRCPTNGERLFKESVGSLCFQGGSRCEGQCLPLADQSSCRLGNILTSSPTIASTLSTIPPSRPTVIVSPSPTSRFPITTFSPIQFPSIGTISPSMLRSAVPTTTPIRAPVGPVFGSPTTRPQTGTMPSSTPNVYQSDFPSVQPISSRLPSLPPGKTPPPSTTGFPSDVPSIQPTSQDRQNIPTAKPSNDVFRSSNPPQGIDRSSKKKCVMDSKKGKGKGAIIPKGVGKGKMNGKSITIEKGNGKVTKTTTKIVYPVPGDLLCEGKEEASSRQKKSGKGKGKSSQDSDFDRGYTRPVVNSMH